MNHFDENMGREFMVEYNRLFKEAVYNSETPKEFESSWADALVISGEFDNKLLKKKFDTRHN